jgi:hypothetical protein
MLRNTGQTRLMSSPNCRNCDTPLPAQAKFCPACGQSIKAVTRPWREVLGELVTELFDFDGRMLVSLRLLLTRPGFLSFEYINGRRASYTSPIRMYLVISLVFFFVLPLILPGPTVSSPTREIAVDKYSQAMFLLLPVFALVLKVFFRQSYYLAHLVFILHLFSAMFIAFAIMLSMEAAADRYMAVMLGQFVLLFYVVTYFVIALRVVYQQSWVQSMLKFLALIIIFLAIISAALNAATIIQSYL